MRPLRRLLLATLCLAVCGRMGEARGATKEDASSKLRRLDRGLPRTVQSTWQNGGIKRRRREASLVVRMAGTARLRANGVSHITRSHDGTNALFCDPKLFDVAKRLYGESDVEYAIDHITFCCSVLSESAIFGHAGSAATVSDSRRRLAST